MNSMASRLTGWQPGAEKRVRRLGAKGNGGLPAIAAPQLLLYED